MSSEYRVRRGAGLVLAGQMYRIEHHTGPAGAETKLRRTSDGRQHTLRAEVPTQDNGLREVVDVATGRPVTDAAGAPVLVVHIAGVLEVAVPAPARVPVPGPRTGECA